jgi:hypothetical protein
MTSLPEQGTSEKSTRTILSGFLEWRTHNKYAFNFIALILFLILLPLFSDNTARQELVYVLIIIVLFCGIFTVSENQLYLVIGSFLAVLSIILNVLYYLSGESPFYQASIIIPFFFFGLITIVLFAAIIHEQRTTFDIVCGAMSVYLLIGITWAYGIMVMELLAPASFSIGGIESGQIRYLPDFISYSFSILTTTGNFDVAAQTSVARMIMMFEMITGTLFIAILISWLVGRLLTRQRL